MINGFIGIIKETWFMNCWKDKNKETKHRERHLRVVFGICFYQNTLEQCWFCCFGADVGRIGCDAFQFKILSVAWKLNL